MTFGVAFSSVFLRHDDCRAEAKGSCKSNIAPEDDPSWNKLNWSRTLRSVVSSDPSFPEFSNLNGESVTGREFFAEGTGAFFESASPTLMLLRLGVKVPWAVVVILDSGKGSCISPALLTTTIDMSVSLPSRVGSDKIGVKDFFVSSRGESCVSGVSVTGGRCWRGIEGTDGVKASESEDEGVTRPRAVLCE